MGAKLFVAASLIGGLLVAAQITGCTIIGTIAGASSSHKAQTVEGWDLHKIASGRKVRLVTRSDSTIETTFNGTYILPSSHYRHEYQDWTRAQADDRRYPAFESKVTVERVSGRPVTGVFTGLDVNGVNLNSGPRFRSIPLSDVRTVRNEEGEEIAGSQFTEDVVHGNAPLRRHYRFGKSPDSFVIDPREVESVYVYEHNALLTGFLIGLTVDIAIVAVLVATQPFDGPSVSVSASGGGMESCPYVYSWDGEDYTLDAEPLAAAWFEAAQRTDFVRLDHLRLIDDEYRVRVVTELDETDHLDAVRLVVVDHVPGTEVVPTFDGRMLVLSDPVRPVKAIAYDGGEVLDQVAEKDDVFWASNPFGRNLNDPSQTRDGVIVEFPRPVDSDSATLAFTVKNLPWTSQLGPRYLRLFGEGLPAWYETMNTAEAARNVFTEALKREVLLSVEVWTGERWRYVDTIWGIGASVQADRAMRVDLTGVPHDMLRVRLSSTAGLWMINRAVADYGSMNPSAQFALPAASAIDDSGADILDEISEIDGNLHVMPEIGNRIDLTFDAPPLTSGLERTLVFATTGFYQGHHDLKGPSDVELATRLATVPGAFGQWALADLYRDIDKAMASLATK